MSGTLGQDNSAGTVNAQTVIGGSALGTELTQLLMAEAIEPGSDPSYQIAKVIYEYHPLGSRLVDEPIILAQSQTRDITIPDSPEQRVKEAFEKKWVELGLDSVIFGTVSTGRIYGIGSLIYGAVNDAGEPLPTNEPIDPWDLQKYTLYFSVMDPLNTSGSIVLNQNPNAPDFQKTSSIAVAGQPYHSSRSVTFMNERPIYISYTNSAFGFVGRSVYQRALYPLKSYIRSMVTDDLVCTKAGLIVAKIKQPGSIIDNVMAFATGVKRKILKEAQTGNVLSIDPDESIETLNMMNIDGAFGMARRDIQENIAAAAAMPAAIITGDSFAMGFGEGTEDAKKVAHYIHRLRLQMQPIYAFCDRICMHVAWSEDFYKTIQAEFPEYEGIDYKTAFYRWKNSFRAEWPSLLIEPESERAKGDDVKLKAVIAMLQVLLPELDEVNQVEVMKWASDNFNDLKMLFTTPLMLDFDSLEDFAKQRAEMAQKTAEAGLQAGAQGGEQEPAPPPPESARDSMWLADAQWREADHPRDEDGKFSDNASQNASKIKVEKDGPVTVVRYRYHQDSSMPWGRPKMEIGEDGQISLRGRGSVPSAEVIDRVVSEFLSPFGPDTYVRSVLRPDDYKYLQEGTHRGSKNHATGEDEEGISAAHVAEFPSKYAYLVKGKEIGVGSDHEPMLETKTARVASKLMKWSDMEKLQEKAMNDRLQKLGMSRDQYKALVSGKWIRQLSPESGRA